MVGTIDFLVGGFKSTRMPTVRKLEQELVYVTTVAGDLVEIATEPIRKAYRIAEVAIEIVRSYFNPMSQVD